MGKSQWDKGTDKAVYDMMKGGRVNNYNDNYNKKSNGGNGKGKYKDDSAFWLGIVVAFIVINLIFKFL